MTPCSGLGDELCPPKHMQELHETATHLKVNEIYRVANGTHNVRFSTLFLSFSLSAADLTNQAIRIHGFVEVRDIEMRSIISFARWRDKLAGALRKS